MFILAQRGVCSHRFCVFCVDFGVGRGKKEAFPFSPSAWNWLKFSDRWIVFHNWLYVYVLFCLFVDMFFSLRIFSRCSIDSCFQVGYRLSSYWRGFHSPKKASQFNDLLFTMEKYNPCRQTSIVFFNSVFINLEWRSCFYLSLLHQIKRPQQRTWCHRWFYQINISHHRHYWCKTFQTFSYNA